MTLQAMPKFQIPIPPPLSPKYFSWTAI